MNDFHAADYCPTCGQPRERASSAIERDGLKLSSDNHLSFGPRSVRLKAGRASFMRALMARGKATHEFMILSVCPETESNVVQVYACDLRKQLANLTHGQLALRTVWGWGYELVHVGLAEAA